jgi:hypothetical protein
MLGAVGVDDQAQERQTVVAWPPRERRGAPVEPPARRRGSHVGVRRAGVGRQHDATARTSRGLVVWAFGRHLSYLRSFSARARRKKEEDFERFV